MPGSPCPAHRASALPAPRGTWSSRSGFVSRRKATQLTFPVRRARHPRPESKHGWKAAVLPDAAAPQPAHGLRQREGEALPGWQRQLSLRLGINPCLEESDDQKAGSWWHLVPVVWTGLPLGLLWSKVEGPIARALIHRTWKGSEVKSVLAPSIKSERLPCPFLTHCPEQTWWHTIHSQEMKVLHLCLAFRL